MIAAGSDTLHSWLPYSRLHAVTCARATMDPSGSHTTTTIHTLPHTDEFGLIRRADSSHKNAYRHTARLEVHLVLIHLGPRHSTLFTIAHAWADRASLLNENEAQ
jgi:hypothetical protein